MGMINDGRPRRRWTHLTAAIAGLMSMTLVMGHAAAVDAPRLTKDVNPGSAGSAPIFVTALGRDGTVILAADDGTHGVELWASKGSPGTTRLIKDIRSGAAGSFATPGDQGGGNSFGQPHTRFPVIGSTAYLIASEAVGGRELWRTDGTSRGTVRVADINPGSASSDPDLLRASGGKLFFVADDGAHGTELWTTDGTAAGTAMVKDINPSGDAFGDVNFPPDGFQRRKGEMIDIGGAVVFLADDGSHGEELWISDGTSAGTHLVADVRPGSDGSSGAELTKVGDEVYFFANDGTHGPELWRTDLTPGGTTLVKDIDPANIMFPVSLTVAGSTVFFSQNDGNEHGWELWKTDGTEAGTVMVKDIYPGSPSGFRINAVAFRGKLFFRGEDPAGGAEPWVSDGTEAGTVRLKDVNPGSVSGGFGMPTVIGSTLLFGATDPSVGAEARRTDGTSAGTTLAWDINPGAGDGFANEFTGTVGDKVYMAADDGTNGYELFVAGLK